MSVIEIFPDFFRSAVTTNMIVLLVFSLAQAKCEKKGAFIGMGIIILINMIVNIGFYIEKDYTMLAKFDLVFFMFLFIGAKPFFKESIMQWCFNCITTINIYAMVVFLSYHLCDFFPYPFYANTVLRFLFLGIIIVLFYKYLRPLYGMVVKKWNVFFVVALAIFLNFATYFIVTDDIEATLTSQLVPMSLLTLLSICVYISIFHSLKNISEEYELREKNIRIQSEQDFFNLCMDSMQNRFSLMEEVQNQNRIRIHDHRHFNNNCLELLKSGQIDLAIALLSEQQKAVGSKEKAFCENKTVNATVCYFAEILENETIEFSTKLDIPEELSINSLKLSIMISNLLENAMNACRKQAESNNPFIHFKAVFTGQLLLEIENSYEEEIQFDKNGYPTTGKEGHGIGTKSVIAFVKNCNAQIQYTTEDKIFTVRIII